MYKHLNQLIATFIGLFCILQSAHSAVELDRIIAVINDDVVMKSELDDKVRTVKKPVKRTRYDTSTVIYSGKTGARPADSDQITDSDG